MELLDHLVKKNSLTNNNGFSPNQLVFSKTPNYPTIEIDLPPALENKTSSELIQENLNSLHSTQENFIKVEHMLILFTNKVTLSFTKEQTTQHGKDQVQSLVQMVCKY